MRHFSSLHLPGNQNSEYTQISLELEYEQAIKNIIENQIKKEENTQTNTTQNNEKENATNENQKNNNEESNEENQTKKNEELNIEKSNTQKQNIYGSSTDSIPFRDCAADCLPERKGRDAMSLTEIESYRELIQENIGYEYLCQQYETYREDLDEIVELIVETVCAKRKTTRIAGSDFPHEIVRSRFLKLDNSHIEFVMDCLQKNTTEIRNMKQYLLTVLFNAPTTISNHYTSQVNHDLYGGW